MNSRILTFTCLAFLLPLGALLVIRFDDVQELVEIDPQEAPGRVLYFTSPS